MAKAKKIILTALALRLTLIFISGYHPDILNHVDWGLKFWQYGPKNFYEQIFWGVSWPNQPVGAIYLFGIIAKLYQMIYSTLWWLNLKIPIFPSFVFPFIEHKLHIVLLKTPFILADLGIGWLIYKIIKDLTGNESKSIWGAGLFLFNPALIYNSVVWGQTDSLINLLAFLGIYLLYRKKYLFGFLSFFACLYLKLSLIIWLPILVLIIAKDLKKVILPLVLSFGFYLLVSLPFVHHGNVFTWLWYLYTNRVLPRQGNMLSGNAFNFWTLVYSVNLGLKETVITKYFGRIVTLILVIISTLLFLKRKKRAFYDFLFLMVLYSFSFFLFMTNMHERYLYPVFAPLIVLTAAGIVKKRWYLVLSTIHFLNLYNLWNYPKINFLKFFLEGKNFFVPRLFSLILILVFGKMIISYYNYNKPDEKK